MLAKGAVSCTDWSSDWSPVEDGWCTGSRRGHEGGLIWETHTEKEEEECQISPRTSGGRSRSGTPWPGGWEAVRAWGGEERTYCCCWGRALSRFSLCQDLLRVPCSASLQLIDSRRRSEDRK